jgi:rod shape-determining protein MreC
MAFAGGGFDRPSSRDSSPGLRFFFFAGLSIVLMYFDQRDGWSERIRFALQAAAYPIQVAIGSPQRIANTTKGLFETRGQLRTENATLRELVRSQALSTMRNVALERENERLRGLTKALPPLVSQTVLADVVNADIGRLRQRLIINKGRNAGLYRSQSLLDGNGLVGQLVRVGPWSAEVMLITDPEHAVPVEIPRNGIRTIAVGTGIAEELQLPYLPVSADVKAGDLLVTSGLGGVFPAGVPVGVVIDNKRDPDDILARVRARPKAALSGSKQIVAVWFNPAHPAAPVNPALTTDLPAAAIAQPVVQPPAEKLP